MNTKLSTLAAPCALMVVLLTTAVTAADYKCNGNRVERAGATAYTVRRSGPDVTVEKAGASRARALRTGDGYTIEVNGVVVATLDHGVVLRDGARWASVTDAQRLYDCPDPIAVTLWVLDQVGGP